MVQGLKVTFVFFVISFFGGCSDSSKSNEQLIAVDYSRVTVDDDLRLQAQSDVGLQANATNFFAQAKGHWTITNPNSYENLTAGSFNFLSKSELQTDLTGTLPEWGPGRIVENSPYVVLERAAPSGDQTIVRKVACNEMTRENGVFYCVDASLEDAEVVLLDAKNLHLRDDDGAVWHLAR